ncbi:hypothetical protein HK102_012150 [Quaeritorhiza haematococci]|nr:hypothetical protein HK102_012150 [Quaeritorhiza haematococci]
MSGKDSTNPVPRDDLSEALKVLVRVKWFGMRRLSSKSKVLAIATESIEQQMTSVSAVAETSSLNGVSSTVNVFQTALANPTNSIVPLRINNNNVPIEIVPTNLGNPTSGFSSSTESRPIDPTALIIGSVCGILVFAFISAFWVRRHRKSRSPKGLMTPNILSGVRGPSSTDNNGSVTSASTSTDMISLEILPAADDTPPTVGSEHIAIDIAVHPTAPISHNPMAPKHDAYTQSDASVDEDEFVSIDLSGVNDDCMIDYDYDYRMNTPAASDLFAVKDGNLSYSPIKESASSSMSTPSDIVARPVRTRSSTQASHASNVSEYSFTPSIGEAAPPNLSKANRTVEIAIPFDSVYAGEMTVETGDVVEVVRRYERGWAWGQNLTTGSRGMFPMDVVCDRDSVETMMEAAMAAVDEISVRFDGHSFLEKKREANILRQLATKGIKRKVGKLTEPELSGLYELGVRAASNNVEDGGRAEKSLSINPGFDEGKLAFRLWLQAEIDTEEDSQPEDLCGA